MTKLHKIECHTECVRFISKVNRAR